MRSKNIEKIRGLVSCAGVKFALALYDIAEIEEGKFVVKDRELYDMITQAQRLCSEICDHIDRRNESNMKA